MGYRKFDKIYRIAVPQYTLPINKGVLSDAQVKSLLTGPVEIEEKLDGANTGIIRCEQDSGFLVQKRGSLVGPSEHAQYRYLVNWANSNIDKILKMPMDYIFYVELLYAKHHIYYTRLPSYVIVTDIWDGTMYVERDVKERLCADVGMAIVPLVHSGPSPKLADLFKLIKKSSYHDGLMEGIVVKNYSRGLRGKIVRPEFVKEINDDDHWANKPITKNKLAEGAVA